MPSLNLKTHRFTYWGGNNVSGDMLLYCNICACLLCCCSPNRTSSLFLLFVAFLALLHHCFKALLLVWCLLFTEPSLKNVVTKGVRPCPCDLCVFEKRCFFGKKKNWYKALCPQIYLLSNRNVLMCKETSWINAWNWLSLYIAVLCLVMGRSIIIFYCVDDTKNCFVGDN